MAGQSKTFVPVAEKMRREGYEFQVGRPRVLTRETGGRVELRLSASDDAVLLQVRDDGPGIDDEERELFVRLAGELREMLEASRAHGDKEYIVHGDRRISYAEHVDMVASVARALRERYGEAVPMERFRMNVIIEGLGAHEEDAIAGGKKSKSVRPITSLSVATPITRPIDPGPMPTLTPSTPRSTRSLAA